MCDAGPWATFQGVTIIEKRLQSDQNSDYGPPHYVFGVLTHFAIGLHFLGQQAPYLGGGGMEKFEVE